MTQLPAFELPASQLSTVGAQRFVLTTVEFDVLWEQLALGPTPVVLRLVSPGRTWTERREIVAGGWQALRNRGLAGPNGPNPELVQLVHVLAHPARQLEVRAWCGREVRGIAAEGTGTGVLAVRQDATVTLERCSSLPLAITSVLPEQPAGPGRSATVPADALGAALGAVGESNLRSELLARDVPDEDASLLARMLDGAQRRAHFSALAADRWGVLRRLPQVIGVLEGPRGRYLMTRTTGEDGVDWVTFAPVDHRRLRERLSELLQDASTAAAAQP